MWVGIMVGLSSQEVEAVWACWHHMAFPSTCEKSKLNEGVLSVHSEMLLPDHWGRFSLMLLLNVVFPTFPCFFRLLTSTSHYGIVNIPLYFFIHNLPYLWKHLKVRRRWECQLCVTNVQQMWANENNVSKLSSSKILDDNCIHFDLQLDGFC